MKENPEGNHNPGKDLPNGYNLRKFVAPEFIFGSGARFLAGRYAKNFGAQKVLLVSDPGVMAAGWTEQVAQSLAAAGVPFVEFFDLTPNPNSAEVMAGAQVFRQENCHVIVAVGGGSPMDCAKGIGIVSSNQSDILRFEGVDQVEIPIPPLICIPTTAGTSADVSQFAIIKDRQQQIKIAIVSKAVVPDVSLIDPEVTTTMDANLTACTGLDALCHAMEAYTSVASSPITDLFAREAVRLVFTHLEAAVNHPYDLEQRSQMMLASLYAGLAFSNAGLGAVHALAHSLGGLLDLPHGECNALLLEHVLAFNFDAVPERYRQLGSAIGLDLERKPADTVQKALLDAVSSLRQALGLNQTLGQLGLKPEHIPSLVNHALHDPCLVTNPRIPSRRDLEAIYEKSR